MSDLDRVLGDYAQVMRRLSLLEEAVRQYLFGEHWEGGTEGAHYGGRGVCIEECANGLRRLVPREPTTSAV